MNWDNTESDRWVGLTCFAIGVALINSCTTLYTGVSNSSPGRLFLATKFGSITYGTCVAIRGQKRLKHVVLIKYIVGLPGDSIHVKGRYVTVDGLCFPVKEPWPCIEPGEIPQGHCFVMGLSGPSCDSRYEAVGLLPLAACEGVVRVVVF